MSFACARPPIQSTAGVVRLRPELPEDGAFLMALFRSARLPEFSALPDGQAEKLLQMQFRAMREGYRREFPAARYEVIELDGEAVGRLVTEVRPDGVRYVDIAILEGVRRRGIAAAVMLAVLEEPRRLGVSARVQVAARNGPSLRLCARLGFRVVAEAPPFLELEWAGAQPVERGRGAVEELQ